MRRLKRNLCRTKYYDRWSQRQTDLFIEARIDLDYLFKIKVIERREAWERVGAKCGLFEEDWRRLRKKWTNLIAKYKHIKEHPVGNNSSGGGDKDIASHWPHYERLDFYYTQCKESTNVHNSEVIVNNEKIEEYVIPDEALIKIESSLSEQSSPTHEPSNTSSPPSLNAPPVLPTRQPQPPPSMLQSESHTQLPYTPHPSSSSSSSQEKPLPSSDQSSSTQTTTTQTSRKILEDDDPLQASILKTVKEIRKAARAFTKFLAEKFNIVAESSDSE